MSEQRRLPTVLTVAGSDPSGGAGLQMDLKAFAAMGVHGCSVVTAVTAQNTSRVTAVHPLEPARVKEQLDVLYEDLRILAVKTGMLHDASIAEVVARKVAEEGTLLVVDPVLASSSGTPLSDKELVPALKQGLLPKASLVTPNIPEAAELTEAPIRGEEGMRRACQDLYRLGCESVLLKGGHLPRGPVIDLLFDGKFRSFESPRLDKKMRGTGCLLSAYITALLAKGIELADAVEVSRRHVLEAIRFSSDIGKGMAVGNPLVTLHNSAQRYHVLQEVERWTAALEELLPVSLVPEVGINFAFALPFAASHDDVCALEGRLVRCGQKVRRAGHPAFGASRHVATVVLAAMATDRRMRCAVNLRYSRPVVEMCRTLGFKVGTFDRRKEPHDASTMDWGTRTTVSALGFVPDIIYDEGGPGKEPMIRLLGEHPQQVVGKVQRMVKELREHR